MNRSTDLLYGGVEAGGTKVVCAVGRGPGDLRAVTSFATRDPRSTVDDVLGFFRAQSAGGMGLRAIGIGSFGPLDLDPASPAFGRISTTPKPGWQDVDLRGLLADGLGLPVAIDTDVNAAALGEAIWGAARGIANFLYVTVGTGVGVGAVVNGRLLHGEQHPEMGHMLIPVSREEPAGFRGTCPYHGTCVEGLASGTAVVSRWGRRLDALPENHPAWALEAGYLADFFTSLTFALQPRRIIVGGGVAGPRLVEMTRRALHARLAGYRPSLAESRALDDYLVMPRLGAEAGVLGAIGLARRADGEALEIDASY